jgi:hypothetical protein
MTVLPYYYNWQDQQDQHQQLRPANGKLVYP